jgi:phosphoribulokinase
LAKSRDGSSRAGTTTVKTAFQQIFRSDGVKSAIVEGDAFHRFDRAAMRDALAEAHKEGRVLSHFGPDGNLFEELESLFRVYGQTGTAKVRQYLHDEEEAAPYGQRARHVYALGEDPEASIATGTHAVIRRR